MRKFWVLFHFSFFIQAVFSQSFDAKWISPSNADSARPNSWSCYRKNIELGKLPSHVIAKISTDTKYWVWINGKLVIYEGGLKRGPNPNDTYYDEVDISPYFKKGINSIAILTWFWGGKGFSHHNSGKSGLYFQADKIKVTSDVSWKAIQYESYYASHGSVPNYRLSEPNIFFDARKEMHNWNLPDYTDQSWKQAIEIGPVPVAPWNNLIRRPIPMFRYTSLKSYSQIRQVGDTLVCKLPYNGQFSPYFKIKSKAGVRIFISTDTYFMGAYENDSLYTLGSEYITRDGTQEYESLGWLSGHEMRYVVPKGVEVLSVMFRESGYDATFAGSFNCSDSFLNKLWSKARRTLYVNMRDNYMDCPDRERAEWAGDAALEMGQSFYCLDRNSDHLSRKFFHDLINWQRADSTIYNPVPETAWKNELPVHSLMPMSELWTYFQFTNDTTTLRDAYPALRRYLGVWKIQESGQLVYRKGGWDWGDWGDNIDFVLVQHAWYLRALQTSIKIAKLIEEQNDIEWYKQRITAITSFLNGPDCWNGSAYRHKGYKKKTDDRANAMMVITGIADETKWKLLSEVMRNEEHASPFMEKFVLEALIKMNMPEQAIARMKKRFHDMVVSHFSTLWELWEHNEGEVHGNSGYNHGWAGGPLILLSQYFAGMSPVEGEDNSFQIKPILNGMKHIEASMLTKNGILAVNLTSSAKHWHLISTIPRGMTATIGLPKRRSSFKKVTCNGHPISTIRDVIKIDENTDYYFVRVNSGTYNFTATW